MRILTRYILGEIFSHTLIGLALFTFVLFMRDLPKILEMVVRNSSSLESVVEIFLFSLPNIFLVTIPMAVLVGVLLGLSRLAADSEVTAMRASGLGIWYFVRVSSIVAIAGTLLGLANSLYLAPRANQAILAMQQQLETSQASYEIQPRVFYEEFRNYVPYVQDVRSGVGAANWRNVFIADLTDPATPTIITAQSATVINDTGQTLLMRLHNGTEHQTSAQQPSQYNLSTFSVTDLPLELNPQSDVHLGRMDTPILAMPNNELVRHYNGADGKRYRIEMQKRFSYPVACLVLMLAGVPLGVSSRRGGKSSGFVFTILLVFLYYFLSSTGVALGRQSQFPAWAAVWSANILFAAAGLFLLWQMARGGSILNTIQSLTARTPHKTATKLTDAVSEHAHGLLERMQPRRSTSRSFPQILDEYILREFLLLFAMIMTAFVMLLLVFTFFELLGDILRNHTPLTLVGDYLLNLTPRMIYETTPLCVLLAVLITFGVLNRNSELIAMKATGISLYRLVIPVLVVATMLAGALFAFEQYYLPQANRKQEQLRAIIKGRPAQTFLRPDRHWIFGEQRPNTPERIYYYQFFDPDKNEFANLNVFEFNASGFTISRRIFAARANWDQDKHQWNFQNGWVRAMNGADVTGYREFPSASFAEVREDPGYFKKENLQSQEMNFTQLQRYIRDLGQSGFDTMRLQVELYHKLAYPLITVVMAILAVPFALSMGRRGSLTGIAVAIGVALAYWVIAGLFEAMGNVNYLPAALAAWSPDILFGLIGSYLLLRTPT